ncbi:EF-hand domain pair [Trinorchestia longiramus]|nr:EF-hand domain pair [Trinorchestia longiramus]
MILNSLPFLHSQATDIDEQTLHALRKAFAVADVERNGSIETHVLKTSLANAGISADAADLESALSQVKLKDGRVSWDIFVLLAASFLEEEDEEVVAEELREAFMMYDKDATVVEWCAARVLYRVSACAERLRAGSKPGNDTSYFSFHAVSSHLSETLRGVKEPPGGEGVHLRDVVEVPANYNYTCGEMHHNLWPSTQTTTTTSGLARRLPPQPLA